MFPSAKALATSLSAKLNRKVYVTTNPDTTLRGPVIRWGNGDGFTRQTPINIPAGNSYEFITHCSNKRLFSDIMVQLEIPCVSIQSGIPASFPVVIRRTLTGYGGAGIILAKDTQEFIQFGDAYWSYYRRFRPELGVHIFNGRIIKLFKKVWKGEGDEPEFPIRNASRGYHFSVRDVEDYPKLTPFVENFYSKFPIMFGRLDIGWDYDEKTYRVIEMNTAPGLVNNPDTLEAYTNAFMEIL